MKTALAIIIALLVIGGGYLLFANKTQAPVTNPATGGGTSAPLETTNPNGYVPSEPAPQTDSAPAAAASAPSVKTVTVTYDGSSFSPATATIKKGDTVKFVDTSSSQMWVASAPHPTHQGYSGTTVSQHCPDTAGVAFDECAPGNTYTFTFQKIGSWAYHNHFNTSAHGTVVVQ